jgi:two-component system LytT family sensor kinase
MVLFLFAISFAHFSSDHAGRAWSGEVAFHHAGIPLALFVLLQDYRFLLLDTFIRFLVNACLAAAAIAVAVAFGARFEPLRTWNAQPFYGGLAFVGACVLLILFGGVRRRAQAFITRALFLRENVDSIVSKIQELAARQPDEETFLTEAAKAIASYARCDAFDWIESSSSPHDSWVELALPVTFAHGDSHFLRLGTRRGGRLFLSEDLEALQKLVLEVARQVDRLRAIEMQALVTKGELNEPSFSVQYPEYYLRKHPPVRGAGS